MEEIWKDVKGYEGYYQVSNLGRVKSVKRYKNNHSKLQLVEEKVLSQYVNRKNGYVYVYLCKDGDYRNKRLHIVVAESFIENPNGFNQINHIDGNKENNAVENLEWCNGSYNVKDKYKRSGVYEKDSLVIGLYEKYKNCNKVAKEIGMTNQGVQAILKRNNIHIYSRKEQREIGWL